VNAFVYHVQINVGDPGAIAFYRALFGFLDYRSTPCRLIAPSMR
jgi:hypothetical protein